jgi:phage gp29-like protein
MSSSGTRNIDIDPIIRRYQHDIARSVLSEFLMLGGGSNGSYALSKSKTDLFLRALESYITQLVDTMNKQLIEPLWELNNLDPKLMPKLVAGDVAPHDLKELGSYLRNLNGADINLADQPEIVDALLHNAELPKLDRKKYDASLELARQAAMAPTKEVVEAEEEDEDPQDTKQGN